MTFLTDKSAHAPYRGRSRTMGRCYVSCELLEGRQLLSTMLQPGGWVSFLPSSAPGGWQPRWIDMTSRVETPGAQVQAFSDPADAVPGANVEFGSGGTQIQSVSGGGTGSISGATVTSPSANVLPGGEGFLLAGTPTRIVSTEGTGFIAGSPVTSPVMNTLPQGLNLMSGGGQSLVVNSANNGAMATQSSTTLPQGPVVVGQGNAPMEIVSRGSAGSTAGPIVANLPLSVPPADLNVEYGPAQALFVSSAGNEATTTASSTALPQGPVVVGQEAAPVDSPLGGSAGSATGPIVAGLPVTNAPEAPYVMPGFGQGFFVSGASDGATATVASTGLSQGAVVVGPGGAPVETMSSSLGSTAGSTVATSSTGASTGSVEVSTNGAPMQVVSGSGSQSGISSTSSGSSTSSSST